MNKGVDFLINAQNHSPGNTVKHHMSDNNIIVLN